VRRILVLLQAAIVGLAAALLLLPANRDWIERYYADWLYPSLQAEVTSSSNASGYALFDVLVGVAVLALITAWGSSLRRAWRQRSLAVVGRALMATFVFASVLYVWFAVAWGLNYSRSPLEASIGFDAARVTGASLRALADRATREVNETYAAAHQAGFPAIGDVPAPLVVALHDVEHRLGRPRRTVPGRPKRTIFALFFRASGVDGMHAPFLLETLLNPDLTPPERPAVLAHEWAHLAGYALEADASFVGLLAALRADPGSQYSAWLALFDHAVGQLPRTEQHHFVGLLAPGPQADRRAISERLQARVDVVADASWQTYDQYLKAQGVDEGIENYSRVVQLLLGSGALDWP
jgi:hypothetical protein